MTAVEAARWTHPLWCDEDNEDRHIGLVTSWQLRGDDALVTLYLTRWDDCHNGAQEVLEPKVFLGIRNTAILRSCECGKSAKVEADVHLDVEDARLLLGFLERHVRELELGFGDCVRSES